MQKQLQSNQFNSANNSISYCLDQIKSSWKQKNNLAGLLQDWANIAGAQLSSNCTPLNIQNKILTIGASHPQWRQAIFYNRLQLIESLKSKGYNIKEIKIKQFYQEKLILKNQEKEIWEKHPSRIDIHGKVECPKCKSPSPSGEISLWNKCIFCRRIELG